MKDILGRSGECKRLDMCLSRDEAQLIVVYGRRRVGKTFLINSYFDNRFDFKFTGEYKAPRKVQLYNFANELRLRSGKEISQIENWRDAFWALRDYLEKLGPDEKHVVFFDEMPWMDTPKSGFLEAFEYFWNAWGSSKKNLVFVVCGSASSWLTDNIEKNKGGLYNRLTARLFLDPFTLSETEEYLKDKGIDWPRYVIAEAYMIMGGIPYYLSLLDSEKSYNANIDNIFFRKNAELFDEFEHLYHTLFTNSEQHIKIVEALSTKRGGMTKEEIISRTKLADNGNLTKALKNLEYAGFIRTLSSYKNKKKNRVFWLSDYYTSFYFRFLKDNSGKDEHYWANTLDNPSRSAWAGLTFEQVCMDHIGQIKKKLGISGVLAEVST